VAAVQHHQHVRAPGRDLGDQVTEFLVGEVGHTRPPAVDADKGLVLPARLEEPEALLDRLVGAVAGEAKDRDVVWPCLAEVQSKPVDDPLTGGLLLEQFDDTQRALLHPTSQKFVEPFDVVDAAAEGVELASVVVDADEQGVDDASHRGLRVQAGSLSSATRNTPRTGRTWPAFSPNAEISKR
jgi:hypothetical protein